MDLLIKSDQIGFIISIFWLNFKMVIEIIKVLFSSVFVTVNQIRMLVYSNKIRFNFYENYRGEQKFIVFNTFPLLTCIHSDNI